MRRFLASLVSLAIIALALPMGSRAQQSKPIPRTSDGKPDFTGIWNIPRSEMPSRVRFGTEDPPLFGEALELYQYNREGLDDPNEGGLDDRDPITYCYPIGPTRFYTLPRPFMFVNSPGLILWLSEWDHTVRRIYTDGRGHPDGYPMVWQGHSIGRWDGDTLVVDTTNVRTGSWVDNLGTPHSEDLHIVERITRLDYDTLEIDVRFDDPKSFTKPWGGKKMFEFKPDFEILDDVNCEEFLQMGKPRGLDGY